MIRPRVRTLLLVEDEVIVARIEARQLTDRGYKVVVVHSGEEALEIVRDQAGEIDLILMDIDLGPGLDGTETAREILKRHDIPIIFLSSHTEKEYVDKTKEIGSYGYVIKDSGITVLQASVDMAFRLHQAHRETRKAEERLRAAELFNFTLFQYNPIQTVIVDREGRVVKSNLAKMNSGDRLPNIGDLIYRDYAGKHTIDMRAELEACLVSGKPARFPSLPYGEKILDVSIAPFTEGAIIASLDVTGLARAQEQIRLSEQRLTLAQHAAGAGVWNWDWAGNRLVMSPELYALLGRSPETDEDAVTAWTKAVHPEDRKALARCFDHAVRNKIPVDCEYRIIRPDGRTRWMKAMGSAAFDESGRATRLDGISLDITEFKFRENLKTAVYQISEVALQAETIEDIFRSLHQVVNTLMSAENFYIALYDPEKKLISFPYFVDEYDEPPQPQPVGRGLTEYVLFRGEPLHLNAQQSDALERAGEIVLLGAPSADWLGVPLKIRGQTIGVMAVQTYVAGAFFEDEDQDMLMFVSGQAAAAIERKRGEQALQKIVKQKEVLMRELQHRTKNSLALVSSLLGLEKENLTDPRARDIFSKTRSRIGSIASMYERLSDSVDYGNIPLHLYVREIAENVFRSFAPETGRIKLKTKLEEMTLDPKQAVSVGLILNELLMNSLKYGFSADSTGQISIELKNASGRIVLIVEDDGVGFPNDFNIKNAAGTGLGIVRILTEQLDGEVHFRPGPGSRVELSFGA
ncbi:MAG: response regulator [Candidatus Aminicenantes bacterium]|nr:response regulator [Candidatus Aminicenantes bacterium]